MNGAQTDLNQGVVISTSPLLKASVELDAAHVFDIWKIKFLLVSFWRILIVYTNLFFPLCSVLQ